MGRGYAVLRERFGADGEYPIYRLTIDLNPSKIKW